MIKVGLTGNYYSGYEKVAETFELRGIPVFDADLLLRFMVNFSNRHIKKVKKEFGENIYEMGLLKLDKFQSNTQFNKLFDIFHLDILKSYEKWRMNKSEFYTIFKSGILFEREFNNSMNFNISVFKPKQDRKEDMYRNNSILISTIYNIITNEMDEIEKNAKSDFIVHNYAPDRGSSYVFDKSLQIENINKAIMNRKVPDVF